MDYLIYFPLDKEFAIVSDKDILEQCGPIDGMEWVRAKYDEKEYQVIVVQMGKDLVGTLQYVRQLRFEKHLAIRQILASVPIQKPQGRAKFVPLNVSLSLIIRTLFYCCLHINLIDSSAFNFFVFLYFMSFIQSFYTANEETDDLELVDHESHNIPNVKRIKSKRTLLPPAEENLPELPPLHSIYDKENAIVMGPKENQKYIHSSPSLLSESTSHSCIYNNASICVKFLHGKEHK
jgi:hypothetical protein